IDYSHIRPRAVVHRSTAEIRVARIALPPLARVGYVRGASDRVPEALQAVADPGERGERSEEHTSELQSPYDLVCRLPLEKKNNKLIIPIILMQIQHITILIFPIPILNSL